MFSKVVLVGNVTHDLELRTTQSGKSVLDLRLAINEGYGENTETIFINVTVWGKSAEICNQYLTKGSKVLVDGRLKQDSWKGKDGNTVTKIGVVANSVKFLNTKKSVSNEKSVNEIESTQEVLETDEDSVPF